MKRPKKRVRKFSHEQLSRILSMAAVGLIVTEGGNWAKRIDTPYACPLQAAHNVSNACKAARIDPVFAEEFDGEATVYPTSHPWHPTPNEMLDFVQKTRRA